MNQLDAFLCGKYDTMALENIGHFEQEIRKSQAIIKVRN
jgi:hypothetical protein